MKIPMMFPTLTQSAKTRIRGMTYRHPGQKLSSLGGAEDAWGQRGPGPHMRLGRIQILYLLV